MSDARPPRVVCLVPSWTETLIEAGVRVVGRTRYCVHPADSVSDIPVVGGTKDVDWPKVAALAPDLVVFDREENTRAMADSCPYPWVATHVTSVQAMPKALEQLAQALDCEGLWHLAERYRSALTVPVTCSHKTLPLLADAGNSELSVLNEDRPWVYLIWRKPYMTVGSDTFIHSLFIHLGLPLITPGKRYPEVSQDWLAQHNPVLLCASEPYPFAGKLQTVRNELHLDAVLIDGEPLCWYGIRSLRFLESLQG
ncbi:helical backbone metal receptor [Oceanimonas sp. CHS3-5]|uniref:helical backbone metal receptor n=1 Tax=Oceanimonas sp. CHS3-5 TaxID=3068186 RepID=UPI00273FD5E5|nr:helical backbone metal receptor [Oceanimonas sp. CHS3-5]MDP5293011.1 helical backbone metal receptor [Oceanimonas sp. CHS3-5]